MSYNNLPCDITDNDIELHFGLSQEQELEEESYRSAQKQYLNLTNVDKANVFVEAMHDFKSMNEEYFDVILYKIYDAFYNSDTEGVINDVIISKLKGDYISKMLSYINDIEEEIERDRLEGFFK